MTEVKGIQVSVYGYLVQATPVVSASGQLMYYLGTFDGWQLNGRFEKAADIIDHVSESIRNNKRP